jgi:putative acetyltransferase
MPDSPFPPAIQPASGPKDIETVRRLFLEYARELGVDLCFQGFDEELKTLPGLYTRPLGRLLLAWAGPAPVGCVALRPRSDDVCEMKRMYVQPAFRCQGVGRLLAEAVIAEARQAGYRIMRLDTLAHMRPAVRLYESFGFRPCAPYYHNPLPDVVYLELVLNPIA